jgi:hypothetical protein
VAGARPDLGTRFSFKLNFHMLFSIVPTLHYASKSGIVVAQSSSLNRHRSNTIGGDLRRLPLDPDVMAMIMKLFLVTRQDLERFQGARSQARAGQTASPSAPEPIQTFSAPL